MADSAPSIEGTAGVAVVRPRSRLYVFTTVLLATLLGTLIVGRRSEDRFTATAVLVAENNGAMRAVVDQQAVVAALQQPDRLQQVVEDLGRDGIAEGAELDIAEIRRELVVDSEPVRTNLGMAFSVTCTASGADSAMAIVNRLSNRYVYDQASQVNAIGIPAYRGSPYADAATAAQQADANYQQVKAQLDAFLNENLGEMKSESMAVPAERQAGVARYESISLSGASRRLDHSAEGHALVSRYRRLLQRVEEARSEKASARRQERQQWERKFDDRPAVAWHVEPAVRTRRDYSSSSTTLLLVALSTGLICAGSVTLISRRAATIVTAEQAADVLLVPIAGTVVEPESAARPAPPRYPAVVRMALAGSELLLFGLLLSMIAASMLDQDFAQHMRLDPLSALADGARCVIGIVWS